MRLINRFVDKNINNDIEHALLITCYVLDTLTTDNASQVLRDYL